MDYIKYITFISVGVNSPCAKPSKCTISFLFPKSFSLVGYLYMYLNIIKVIICEKNFRHVLLLVLI